MIGWRWSFLGQVPIITLAIALCSAYLPNSIGDGPDSSAIQPSEANSKSKFSRIDFKGSFIFASAILALLLPISIGGVNVPWTHPIVGSLVVLSGLLLVWFIAVEKRQEEPILPLEIFHKRDAVISFLILGLQHAAQLGVSVSKAEGFRYRQLLIPPISDHVFRSPVLQNHSKVLQRRGRSPSSSRSGWKRRRWCDLWVHH